MRPGNARARSPRPTTASQLYARLCTEAKWTQVDIRPGQPAPTRAVAAARFIESSQRRVGLSATERLNLSSTSDRCQTLARRQTHPRLFLRGLLPGPWGHGSRLDELGREVGQPETLC